MARSVPGLCVCVVALVVGGCATFVSFKSADLGIRGNEPAETVSGLFSKPEGQGPFPAVVLLLTCGGVRSHVSEDWPRFLAANGYAALTVDTFGSRGAGRCPGARRFGGEHMWRDAYGALDYLASRPDIDATRIGVMGFSLGAFAVEQIAENALKSDHDRTFGAGIALYGRCTVYGARSFPLLVIIGDRDRNSQNCPREPGVGLSIEILEGAFHAFDQSEFSFIRIVSGNHEAIYDARATERAKALTLAFFDRRLGRQDTDMGL